MKRQILIGVDAGLRNMGIAIWDVSKRKIVETHVVSTGKQATKYVAESNRIRLEALAAKLAAIIGDCSPVAVVAELPTGASKSSRAATAMAMAFSIVVITCKLLDTRLVMIRPDELKHHVNPKARKVDKQEVIAFVSRKFGADLLPSSNGKKEHVADAIACLDCFLNKHYG